jgi:hypothetical protein
MSGGLFSCFGRCGGPLVPPDHTELGRDEVRMESGGAAEAFRAVQAAACCNAFLPYLFPPAAEVPV